MQWVSTLPSLPLALPYKVKEGTCCSTELTGLEVLHGSQHQQCCMYIIPCGTVLGPASDVSGKINLTMLLKVCRCSAPSQGVGFESERQLRRYERGIKGNAKLAW